MDELPDPLVIADAVAGLVHKLNNSLNAILLQAVVLQRQAPEALSGDLRAIQAQARDAARLLQPLLLVRDRRSAWQEDLDLAALLSEAASSHFQLRLSLDGAAAGLWTIQANREDLKRLLAQLLALSVRAAGTSALAVRACRTAEQFLMTIEPAAAADWLDQEAAVVQPMEEIERYAARALARRLDASLSRGPGGCLQVSWAARPAPS
jgi:signal transduction histidine kinase